MTELIDDPITRIRSFINKDNLSIVVFFVFVALLPFILLVFGISITYLTEILIFALGAYGVHLLYGYTGMLSFGHAAFFGGGAYVTTYMLTQYNLTVFAALIIGVISMAILATIIGFFSIRQFGIYFAILTLAFSQVIYFVAIQLELTGGVHGLIGLIDRPPLTIGPFSWNLNNTLSFYLFCAVVVIFVLYVLYRFLNSQIGSVLIAIRENERRAKAIGYDIQKIKILSFVISGAITGLAGALYTLYLGTATPDLLHWERSGDFLFMMILGGINTFFGPLVGSIIFQGLQESLTSITDRWPFFVGLLFVVIVIYLPNGVIEFINEKLSSIQFFKKD